MSYVLHLKGFFHKDMCIRYVWQQFTTLNTINVETLHIIKYTKWNKSNFILQTGCEFTYSNHILCKNNTFDIRCSKNADTQYIMITSLPGSQMSLLYLRIHIIIQLSSEPVVWPCVPAFIRFSTDAFSRGKICGWVTSTLHHLHTCLQLATKRFCTMWCYTDMTQRVKRYFSLTHTLLNRSNLISAPAFCTDLSWLWFFTFTLNLQQVSKWATV